MTWRPEWTEKAIKDLERLDRKTRVRILEAGKRLVGSLHGRAPARARLSGVLRYWSTSPPRRGAFILRVISLVGRAKDSLQVLPGHVGVDLRGREPFMAQHFLDVADVRLGFAKALRITVAFIHPDPPGE